MTSVRCVVCGEPATAEHYPSDDERARGRYPCCSRECADAFEPAVHWLPARFPAPAAPEVTEAMLAHARTLVLAGDPPLPVVCSLLLRGAPPDRVRALVVELTLAADEPPTATRAAGALLTLASLLTGAGGDLSGPRVQLAHPATADAVHGAIDAWCEAAGLPVTGHDPLPRATARVRRDR